MNAAMPPARCALATACSANRGLTTGLGTVDLDDAAPGEAADAERDIECDRTGRRHLDGSPDVIAEAHDGALAELPLDLCEGSLKGLLAVVIAMGTPLEGRVWSVE
ncbi:hypothetical protein GCM10020219_022650 [Nonomuraea dietziae]